MSKKNRSYTALLAAALIFALLFSACYIAMEADHDCAGEDCAIY